MKFYVEIVWNREFNWVPCGEPHIHLDTAIVSAKAMENMGDGARVKKARVVNEDGVVVWQYGKKVKLP